MLLKSVLAFLMGGLICVIAQVLIDKTKNLSKDVKEGEKYVGLRHHL